jgi:hypothetical protein
VATPTAYFVAEDIANHVPHAVEGMRVSPAHSGHDLTSISLPSLDQGQLEVPPAHSGHDLIDISQIETGPSQFDEGQTSIGEPVIDDGHLRTGSLFNHESDVAPLFEHGQPGIASHVNRDQERVNIPQSRQIHRAKKAPLHPALKQAERFCEYFHNPDAWAGPAPPTTFAWFLQQMNISNLGFSEHHKGVLRQYLTDFKGYEQAMEARVERVW